MLASKRHLWVTTRARAPGQTRPKNPKPREGRHRSQPLALTLVATKATAFPVTIAARNFMTTTCAIRPLSPKIAQATGDRRQATGDRRQATGDRRQATASLRSLKTRPKFRRERRVARVSRDAPAKRAPEKTISTNNLLSRQKRQPAATGPPQVAVHSQLTSIACCRLKSQRRQATLHQSRSAQLRAASRSRW